MAKPTRYVSMHVTLYPDARWVYMVELGGEEEPQFLSDEMGPFDRADDVLDEVLTIARVWFQGPLPAVEAWYEEQR